MVRRSSSESASNTMISSIRLMNSGLKVFLTSPSTMSLTLRLIAPESDAWKPIDAFFWMKRAPMFDVMMMIAFLKFTAVPEAVREMAVLEHLQQDVEEIRVRLLDFVQQDHRVRIALHLLGELTALFVPDVSRRRSNQLGDRVLLHVLGHVEADQRVVAAEQEVRQGARQFGLADTGRAEKHEAPNGPVRVLEPCARAPDRARQRRDGLLLRDDALVERVLHVQELVALVLIDRGQRHAGPLRDDLVDLGLADNHAAGARLDVELLAHELQVLARLDFLLAVELRLLEVLLRDAVSICSTATRMLLLISPNSSL